MALPAYSPGSFHTRRPTDPETLIPSRPSCVDADCHDLTGELAARLLLAEAQSLETARDVGRLYRAERNRAAQFEQAQAQLLAYARDLRAAYRDERHRRDELDRSYVQTVRVLALALDARDPYTGGHVDRVARYAVTLGRALGWGDELLRDLEVSALLHDIGKIGVPDAVLRKKQALDDDEWTLMRQHPVIGASMLAGLTALHSALPGILHHHERFDGGGYPDGLSGEAIPPLARAVAIADAFDAMLTTRPYRVGLPLDFAVGELRRCAGPQFDPRYTGAFLELVEQGQFEIAATDSAAAALLARLER